MLVCRIPTEEDGCEGDECGEKPNVGKHEANRLLRHVQWILQRPAYRKISKRRRHKSDYERRKKLSASILLGSSGRSLSNLSTDMQHKCNMLAVEKYTSKLFHTSHMNGPNSHFPDNSTDALNVIAQSATNISAMASDTTK